MSIGEVIALLSPDFPDVSISKIRLWESEGLVEPARTPSGYRKFSHQDVERLRYAMTLQRDRFWPLRKIRDHLDAVSRGAEELVNGASGPRMAPPAAGERAADTDGAQALRGNGPVRLSAAELCTRARIDPEELDALVGFGLLQPSGSGWYDANALAIASAAAELSGFGIQARHLRAFRTAADREVGLVEQVVSPLRGGHGANSRARADDTAQEITAVALRLHAALVRAGLVRAGLG
ncbi:transcriptional regulator FtsR [Angustibacter luteus]|uniref:MerR family transcriptional regulator n=1 Tax=Angustibacter luteus TaxID=658456 RepID=A0ABW1J9K6_9ACTN